MKYSIAIIAATLAAFTNAHLSYDAHSATIKRLPVISTSWTPPLPQSSTPISFSKFTNTSSTPMYPITPSSTLLKPSSHYIPPPPPPSTTPVAPVNPSPSGSYGTGTGTETGYPHPTSKVTTLNSSWKPTLTANSASFPPPTTTARSVQATGGAGSGKSMNALAALGAVGLVAALI